MTDGRIDRIVDRHFAGSTHHAVTERGQMRRLDGERDEDSNE